MPLPLNQFSALAASKADRNLSNLRSLDDWLRAAGDEKLGHGARAEKARSWLSTVARGAMARGGESIELVGAARASLAAAEPWAARAVRSGLRIEALTLGDRERADLLSILDWMRSGQGPSVAADWTRVSWPQALRAHEDWIKALSRDDARHQDASKAFDGCARVCQVVGLAGLDGWSWARPLTAEALDREGALMRHCVGSYAQQVEDGSLAIWSLRDPGGKPKITLETAAAPDDPSGLSLLQVKAFANGVPTPEHASAISSLLDALAALGTPVVHAGSDLGRAGLALTPMGFGSPKLWTKGSPSDAGEALARVESRQFSGPKQAMAAAALLSFMDYPHAFKALAAKILGTLPEESRDILSLLARPIGLALGQGRLAGRALDQRDPADLALAERLAAEPPAAHHEDAFVQEAFFYAREGWNAPLALALPHLESICTRAQMAILSELSLASAKPCAIGIVAFSNPQTMDPFNGKPLWTVHDGPAARALCQALAGDPLADPHRALEACSVFSRLGLLDAVKACEPLLRRPEAAPGMIDTAREAIEAAGGLVQEPALGHPVRVWIPGPAGDAEAQLWISSHPEMARSLLPIALHMKYERAARSSSMDMDDSEALQQAHLLIRRNIDAGSLGARPGLSRTDAEHLRSASALRGLLDGAQAANAALARLPDAAYATADEAREQRGSYARWAQVFGDIHETTQAIRSRPDIVQALLSPQQRDHSTRMIETLPPWLSLRGHLHQSAPASLGLFFECLLTSLALSVPALRAEQCRKLDRRAPSGPFYCAVPVAAPAVVSLYALGIANDQRRVLIDAGTGMSRLRREQADPASLAVHAPR